MDGIIHNSVCHLLFQDAPTMFVKGEMGYN